LILPYGVKYCLVKTVECFAILNSDGHPRPCGKERWTKWAFKGGQARSLIKRNLIDDYLIETCFKGKVSALESEEPCFWRVRLTSPPNPSLPSGSFLGAFSSTLASMQSSKAETILEVLKQKVPVEHELSFTTREDALEHHRSLIGAVRKHQRLASRGVERAQVLLAELGDWCAEKRGRQTEVARAIGVSPQAVNDWLNGRKRMSGEQALRVQEFLLKARRRH
jgi:Helix-turn-helix